MLSTLEYIKKIFDVLTPDWQKITAEAQTIEASLEKAEKFFGNGRSETHADIKKLFQQISQFVSIDEFKVKLQSSELYKKWKDVPIDYANLTSVPANFDIENKSHRDALISSKFAWLKGILQAANISFTTFDLNIALNDLEQIFLIVTDIPTNIDFEDKDALIQLKNQKLALVQPKIISLIGNILNKDLVAMGVEEKLNKANEVVDIALTDDKANTTAEASLLSKVSQKMPRVEKALQGETVAGVNFSKAAKNTGELLSLTEQKIPQIEQEFKALKDDHSPAAIVKHTQALYSHLASIMEHESAKELFATLKKSIEKLGLENTNWQTVITQLQTLIDIPEDQIPDDLQKVITLIQSKAKILLGIADQLNIKESQIFRILKEPLEKIRWEGITQDEFINQLQVLVKFPEGFDWKDPRKVITLIKDKITALLDLVAHIRIEGLDIDTHITRIKTEIGKFLEIPADADLNSLTGVLLVILDKILLLMKESELTKGSWLLEQIEKVQMVVQFIHNNGFHIKIQQTVPLHQQPPSNTAPPRVINTKGEVSQQRMAAYLKAVNS